MDTSMDAMPQGGWRLQEELGGLGSGMRGSVLRSARATSSPTSR